MPKKNDTLAAAKDKKQDEFYTQYEDIQREVNAYLEFDSNTFRDKTVLLPCDDPEWSNFTRFFAQNFESLGLKKLISTSYATESKNAHGYTQLSIFDFLTDFETNSPLYDEKISPKRGKIFTLTRRNKKIDINDLQWKYLEGDGDFRSEEVTKLRDECDIIVTNPPFSLFKEFMPWIMEANKKFLIIGNQNAITYKEIFPLFKDNKIWIGNRFNQRINGKNMMFTVPSSYPVSGTECEIGADGKKYISVSGTGWFTNLEHGRRHQPLSLMSMEDNIRYSKHAEINGHSYPHYETIDGIEVKFTDAIPRDFAGIMGVPKTFIAHYCPEQFEILGYEREDENIQCGISHMPEEFLSTYRQQGGTGHYTKGMKMLCYYDNDGNAKIPFSKILIRYTESWKKEHSEDFE